MRIAVATDAWHPQVNGVVRSLSETVDWMRKAGHSVEVMEPGRFKTIPCPSYPEIRLAFGCAGKVARMLDEYEPTHVHISTEGPIGWAARRWCLSRGRPFTTAFHTRFPDYVSLRTGIPSAWVWKVMRRFHGPAERVFVATATLAAELHEHGLTHTHHWLRGVDLDQFNPDVAPDPFFATLVRPILLNVGRVAVEKNLEAFLELETAGTKVIVGGGPDLERLQARFPKAVFLGPRHGGELASAYRAADVFVFPSRTDTFGLVNIEALACGTPVAAFPVAGPLDILGMKGTGIHGGRRTIGGVDGNLRTAIAKALAANRAAAAREAGHYSWEACTQMFVDGLSGVDGEREYRKAA